jgi:hypothetical protein
LAGCVASEIACAGVGSSATLAGILSVGVGVGWAGIALAGGVASATGWAGTASAAELGGTASAWSAAAAVAGCWPIGFSLAAAALAVAFFARAGVAGGAAASIGSAMVAWEGTFFGARFAAAAAAFLGGGAAFAAGFAGVAALPGAVSFEAGVAFAFFAADCSGWERRCLGLPGDSGLPAGAASSFAGAWNATAGGAFGRRGARSAGLLKGVG